VIVVDADGENLIAVASGANGELTGEVVRSSFASIDEPSAVVLAGLEVPDDAVAAAAEGAGARGWRFVLNPAPARPIDASLVARCDVLIPNEHEVAEVGWDSVGALLDAGAAAVVVTLGGEGAALHRSGRDIVTVPPAAVDVVDTTGSGDAFCGALAAWLAGGATIEGAVEAAVAAGSLATRSVGARESLATRAELERALSAGRA
jgi:ribokinase